MRTGLTMLIAVMAVATLAFAQQAIPKVGNCPSGYSASGNACVPGPNAAPAFPKSGNCPSGYSVSGAYCLKTN